MAMVQPKSARYRLWATHAALLAFVAAILFPLLMVISSPFAKATSPPAACSPRTRRWNTGRWRSAFPTPTRMAA